MITKGNFYFVSVVLITFLLDRYTKNKIINNFGDRAYYINDVLNFDLTWNTGIGFGLLSFDSSLIYNLISCLIASVIIFLTILGLKSKKFLKIIFAFIIGGAVGNFYDRLFFNAVPDFIDLHFNNFHWFVFNVADIFITVGIIIFIFKGNLVK